MHTGAAKRLGRMLGGGALHLYAGRPSRALPGRALPGTGWRRGCNSGSTTTAACEWCPRRTAAGETTTARRRRSSAACSDLMVLQGSYCQDAHSCCPAPAQVLCGRETAHQGWLHPGRRPRIHCQGARPVLNIEILDDLWPASFLAAAHVWLHSGERAKGGYHPPCGRPQSPGPVRRRLLGEGQHAPRRAVGLAAPVPVARVADAPWG